VAQAEATSADAENLRRWRRRVLSLRTRETPLPGLWRESKDQDGYQVKTDIFYSQAEALGGREAQTRANPAVPSAS
jgi:hypothetical protein